MADITATPMVNAAVSTAKDLPDLVDKLNRIDPAMAQQITGKALIASKTPWGVVAAGAVAYISSRYGLGWSENVTDLVAGGFVLVASYGMRYLSSHPITSLFKRSTAIPAPAPIPAP